MFTRVRARPDKPNSLALSPNVKWISTFTEITGKKKIINHWYDFPKPFSWNNFTLITAILSASLQIFHYSSFNSSPNRRSVWADISGSGPHPIKRFAWLGVKIKSSVPACNQHGPNFYKTLILHLLNLPHTNSSWAKILSFF